MHCSCTLHISVCHEYPLEGHTPIAQHALSRSALGDLVRMHVGTHAREHVEQKERRAENKVDDESAEPGRQRGGEDVPMSQHGVPNRLEGALDRLEPNILLLVGLHPLETETSAVAPRVF